MKRRTLIIAAFAAACTPPTKPTAPPAAPASPFFLADSGAIFEGENARRLVNQCSRIAPAHVEGVWTPAPDDIAVLEQGLGPLIDAELRDAHYSDSGQFGGAHIYYRQYGGLILGGRRVIYVNGFNAASMPSSSSTDGPPFDWRHTAVLICDGGPITFGVEYDVATHTFANFAFNGAI